MVRSRAPEPQWDSPEMQDSLEAQGLPTTDTPSRPDEPAEPGVPEHVNPPFRPPAPDPDDPLSSDARHVAREVWNVNFTLLIIGIMLFVIILELAAIFTKL